MNIIFYLSKAWIFLFFYIILPFPFNFIFLYSLYYSFHYWLIPKVFKLQPMTLLDSFMLIENAKNRTIFGGIGIYTKLKYSELSDLRLKLIKQHPRLRQKVVSLFGAYYFKDIPIEEALKGVEKLEGYHTKEELELFCEKICQEPLPKDGPLWKVYVCEDYNEKETAGILIMHHSLFDGLSNLYLTWMYTGEPCDPDMLPIFKEIPFFNNILLHFKILFTFPKMIITSIFKTADKNPINNGKPLSGNKKYATIEDIPFEKIRSNCKILGITLNDYFLSILSKSLKDYFRLKDPKTNYNHINIAIPINIRDKYPKKFSEIKLENKFSAVDLTLPLIDEIDKEAYKIGKITNKMKTSAEFLANSFFLQIGVLLFPKQFMKFFNNFITSKTTLCFSNVPYFKKPLTLENTNCSLIWTTGFFQNNGDVGVGINVMTYLDRIMFGILADEARMENPREFADIFRNNLLELAKNK